MQDDEFLNIICPTMTIEHFEGLFKCLECHGMLAGFLVHGDTTLVKTAIVEFKFTVSYYYIKWDHAHIAIALFPNEDCHDRVVGVLEALQERYATKTAEFE